MIRKDLLLLLHDTIIVQDVKTERLPLTYEVTFSLISQENSKNVFKSAQFC